MRLDEQEIKLAIDACREKAKRLLTIGRSMDARMHFIVVGKLEAEIKRREYSYMLKLIAREELKKDANTA